MEMQQATAIMSAISQPTRYRCYTLLTSGGPLTAGEIAERLDVPPNLLSSHLKILTAAGLIAPSRRGRSICYAANGGAVLALMAHLATILADGSTDGVDAAPRVTS